MNGITFTKRQWEAWQILEDDVHTEVLYGGAAGGAKSFLGCAWLTGKGLQYQGSRWLMGRAVLKTLKETTLNTFFEVARMGGMSANDYTYNQQNSTITLPGGSVILLKDLFAYPSDPNFDELGSLEITGAFIDEANQTTEKARDIVSIRIRYRLDEFGIIPKLLMTCNPAKNWTYRDYYLPWKNETLLDYRAFVPALVKDNPNISKHYVNSLHKLSGADRERLLLGNWEYDEADWQLLAADVIFGLWDFDAETVVRGDGALTWDVAGPGSDRSVYMVWDGLVIVDVVELDGADVNEHAIIVDREAKRRDIPRNRIVVDATGIGTGPAQLLRGCLAFEGGSSPRMNSDFRNFKAECAYKLKELADLGMIGIDTDKGKQTIQDELPYIRQWKGDTDMKVQIMPKQEVRRMLGRSPDYGDNFIMRMALEVVPEGAVARNLHEHAQGRVRRRKKQPSEWHGLRIEGR